jgi:hypothetical protein
MKIGNRKNGDKGVYVGRPSPLGNPFILKKESDRSHILEQYRKYLWEKIQARDETILQALSSLKDDDTLICWCHPKPCHAEIIIRAYNYCQKEGLLCAGDVS